MKKQTAEHIVMVLAAGSNIPKVSLGNVIYVCFVYAINYTKAPVSKKTLNYQSGPSSLSATLRINAFESKLFFLTI